MRTMATFTLSQASWKLRTVIGGENFEAVGKEGQGTALGEDSLLGVFV